MKLRYLIVVGLSIILAVRKKVMRKMVTLILILALAGCQNQGSEHRVQDTEIGRQQESQKRMAISQQKVRAFVESFDKNIYPVGKIQHLDTIKLKGGKQYTGKFIDLGTWDILVNNEGRYYFDRQDITEITLKRIEKLNKKPDLPDLDVTYIERLPRYRSNHGNLKYGGKDYPYEGIAYELVTANNDPMWPPEGSTATFIGHIKNHGNEPTGEFTFVWTIDGKEVKSGKGFSLKPEEEFTDKLEWKWQNGAHTVALKVDEENVLQEISERNNKLEDRTDALGFLFVVSRAAYDGFNDVRNMVDSFSLEDWVQYHVEVTNFLFMDSIYPSTPEGCLERWRIDKIAIVENEGEKFNEPAFYAEKERLQRDSKPSGVYYEGVWQFPPWDQYPGRAERIDWGLIHEMAHQTGLIDEYHFNYHQGLPCRARGRDGNLIRVNHSHHEPQVMMHWHGPHRFSENSAKASNLQIGRHRGFFGDYLYELPEQIYIRILNRKGEPVPKTQIRIWQRQGDSGIAEEPVIQGETDQDGKLRLPNRKIPNTPFTTLQGFTLKDNPFGRINVVGVNGLFLFEIYAPPFTEYHWVELLDLNVAKWRGADKSYTHDLKTLFPPKDAPPPPIFVECQYLEQKKVLLKWKDALENKKAKIKEYRLYIQEDILSDNDSPPKEITRQPAEKEKNVVLNLPFYYQRISLSAVDDQGRESGLSQKIFLADLFNLGKAATAPSGAIYIANLHSHEGVVFKREKEGWFTPTALDTLGQEGRSRPSGITVGREGQVILTFAETKRVGIFDQDLKLIQFISASEPWQKPQDAACDENNIYVLDTQAQKICTFEKNGKFIGILKTKGKDLELKEPQGLFADSKENLFIADTGNHRIFILRKEDSEFIVQATLENDLLKNPKDIVTDEEGRIFIACDAKPSLLVYNKEGKLLKSVEGVKGRPLHGLRGLAIQGNRLVILCEHGMHEMKISEILK